MREKKILSVVVPAYNAEPYIKKNLDTLCCPEPAKDLEILVIDDGSSDRTGEIAEMYIRKYPETIRVFHKENGGHGSGINWGIEHARGLYFKVVDADDWVEPGEFAKLLEILREQLHERMPDMEGQPADIVYSGFLWAVCDGKHPGRFRWKCPEQEPFKGVKYGKCYHFDEVADRIYIRMHNMTIRTAILKEKKIHLDEHCFYVDAEYITYPIPWVRTICFADANVYRYRIGRGGQSMEIHQMQKNEKDYDKVASSLLRFYRKLGNEIPCRPAGKNYICGILSRYVAGKTKIILSYPASGEKKIQLERLNRRLKGYYPEIYNANRNLAVKILRGSRYLAYIPANMLVRIKYRER